MTRFPFAFKHATKRGGTTFTFTAESLTMNFKEIESALEFSGLRRQLFALRFPGNYHNKNLFPTL